MATDAALGAPTNQDHVSGGELGDAWKGTFPSSSLALSQCSQAGLLEHTWFPSSSLLQSIRHSGFFFFFFFFFCQCLQEVAIVEPSCHGEACQKQFYTESARSKWCLSYMFREDGRRGTSWHAGPIAHKPGWFPS